MRTHAALLAIITVVAPTERMTRRIMLVVDHSGSMRGHYDEALSAVREIAEQPTDELTLGCIAFSGQTTSFGKWVSLPSAEGLNELSQWLQTRAPHGETFVIPALTQALAEPHRDLSVVLVSDGVFTREGTTAIVEAIESAQLKRVKHGHGRAVIAVYGIGHRKATLEAIAEAGKGGYFR